MSNPDRASPAHRPERRKKPGLSDFLGVLSVLLFLHHAAPVKASEYDIKAMFLYNFTQFIDWPPKAFPAADAPFLIGILGEDPFGDKVDKAFENKSVKGRRLKAVRLGKEAGGGGQDLRAFHILFVSNTLKDQAAKIAAGDKGASVLTVSDADFFAQKGGMIGFRNVDNRVELDINVDAAEKAGLKISAKLQQVSNIVTTQ